MLFCDEVRFTFLVSQLSITLPHPLILCMFLMVGVALSRVQISCIHNALCHALHFGVFSVDVEICAFSSLNTLVFVMRLTFKSDN